MVQAVAKIPVIEAFNVEGNKQRRDHDDRHVPAQLRVLPRQIKFSAQQEEIDREIHAEQDHEHRRHGLQVGRVVRKAAVAHGKAARTGRAEGKAQTVEPRYLAPAEQHAQPVEQDLQQRHGAVDGIEDRGGRAHLRNHLAHGRAGGVHCGGCMLNAREMKSRLRSAADQEIPMTNYGILIAYMKGILKRSMGALEPVR